MPDFLEESDLKLIIPNTWNIVTNKFIGTENFLGYYNLPKTDLFSHDTYMSYIIYYLVNKLFVFP